MAQWDERNPGASGSPNPSANGGLTAEQDRQAQIQQAIDNAREELDRYVDLAADFIRERPVLCVTGAIAIGFFIGRIASRR